jgi:hypothetical protein
VEAVIISCRKLRRKKLHELYSSTYIYDEKIKVDWLVGACGTRGTDGRFIRGFLTKPERSTLLGRPRSEWEKNIKIDYETTM